MDVPEAELTQFITDSGLVSRKDIDSAQEEAQERGRSLGDILVSRGALSEDVLRRIKSYVLGIPFVSLKDQKVPLDVLSLIPEPIARAHSIVAYKKSDAGLEVAMLDIDDLGSIEPVRAATGLKILPRLTDNESLKHALLRYQKALKDEFGDIISAEAGRMRSGKDGNGDDLPGDELKKVAEDLAVVRIVDTLLRHAIIQGASNIHVEPLEDATLIRYRIDGVLHDAMTLPKIAASGIVARIKVLANLKLEQTRLPQDGRFRMETENDAVSFRVSTMPTHLGEKVVMRVLRETGEGFTLEVLGFRGRNLERMHQALRGSGLILISGPAGSGKTTTAYTLLDILNAPQVNISTIEDPIEYQLKRVNQMQVHEPSGFDYANGLRALLRQDPDILMVGDLRDVETAHLAMNAANMGRLVVATMAAKSAADAVARLIDLGVDPELLASALTLVVGQRLARKRAEEGYAGHVGVHEVFPISSALRDLVIKGASREEIENQARREGMRTIYEDGMEKAVLGITDEGEVSRVTAD